MLKLKDLANQSPDSLKDKIDLVRAAWRRGWMPPPRLSVPSWADQYRQLARESGASSGQWQTATVEIARGPMLAVTEPGVHTITAMVSTQLLKTELLINIVGYFAHLDPCPILLLQPKEDAAEQFSKERITPMLRATPVLRALVGTSKTRDATETILYKAFPGGFLAMAGAGSPDNLARRPVRVVLADEVDKYPITREGDPITLAEERTASFGANWLSVRACSPTVDDESRIAASYAESDQRLASIACPHCGHRQFLEFFKHVEWEKTEHDHRPKTARLACEACGAMWSEGERLRALATVRWHQTRPFTCCGRRQIPLEAYETAWKLRSGDPVGTVWQWWASDRYAVYRAVCADCRRFAVDNEHAGFHASKLYSPWAKDKPADIARKWLLSKDDEDKKQAFWNTQLGLPYRRNAGKEVAAEVLASHGEIWDAEVPAGVGLITVGVDVQDYRIELEVIGWGANEESWSILYQIIDGEFSDPKLQALLDQVLLRRFKRADGRPFEVMAACIDSGGHHTQDVYTFCKARIGRRVWAIKGDSARSGRRTPVWPTARPSNRNKRSYRPVMIGVNAAKDTIASRLGKEQHGPGYCHFPADRDIGYFSQLTSERSVMQTRGGQRFRVWELRRGRANEALDCRVYGYAALCGLLHFGVQLNRRTVDVAKPVKPARVDPDHVPPDPAAPAPVGPTVQREEQRAKTLASQLA